MMRNDGEAIGERGLARLLSMLGERMAAGETEFRAPMPDVKEAVAEAAEDAKGLVDEIIRAEEAGTAAEVADRYLKVLDIWSRAAMAGGCGGKALADEMARAADIFRPRGKR